MKKNSKVSIVLNHAGITDFLLNDEWLEDLLEENAKKIEAEVLNSRDEVDSKANAKRLKAGKPIPVDDVDKTVLVETGSKRKRKRITVELVHARPRDFVYGTMDGAVARAGGRLVRKKKKGKK